MLQQNIPVKLRVNVQSTFYDADGGNAYNVIAELPGTDPALRDEVVMIGGHLDSWHTGVGATDNADGSTTVMEAMRILKAIGARPRRTIRVALWGGEEQGLLGSKAWVAQHLAGDANAAAREKFDVYFNIDNGTGPIYGWYLQNNEEVRPIFDGWLEPLKDLGARRNVIEPVGSTDHLELHRRRRAGLQPDPGLRQLRHPHAPHEHGHGRSRQHRGHPPGGDRHGDVRVPGGEARSQAAAVGDAASSLDKGPIIVIIMTMIVINIHEAKAKLSEYLDAVAKGERVMICKRNHPVAELRAVEQKRTEPRQIGGGPYQFDIPDSFFEPMPDEVLDAFESGPLFCRRNRFRRVSPKRARSTPGSPRPKKRRWSLVDTCAFLDGGRRRRAADRVREAFVSRRTTSTSAPCRRGKSPSSMQAGKLPLPDVPERLVPVERERRGMTALPIDEESALHVLRCRHCTAIRSIACWSARPSSMD